MARERIEGSWRPCTSWSSCTANSMSRIPPGPRFTSRSDRPLLRSISSVRTFMARASRTAPGSSVSGHTNRVARPTNSRPSAADPATGSALMSACSSQFCAHRSQYASNPSSVRLERAGSAFGPQRGVGAEHDPVRGRAAHRRQHGACHALGLGLIAFVHEHHVDVARVVELVPAELSHTDHCELDARCRRARRRRRDRPAPDPRARSRPRADRRSRAGPGPRSAPSVAASTGAGRAPGRRR